MIDIYSKHDNMHKNGFFGLICIDNHIISCVNCKLSTACSCLFFRSCLISWNSNKLNSIDMSLIENDYLAISLCVV